MMIWPRSRLATPIGANGEAISQIQSLTQLVTIAASPTTDTTIQFPAGSLGLGVVTRVTVAIPTAATFGIGIVGATTRYGTGISVNLNTTSASAGLTNPFTYDAATALRITPNLTPGNANGRLRVTIYFIQLTPPSS